MLARLRVGCLFALLATSLGTSPAPPLFTFHSGFWLNLHHFLYVLGRAAADTPDSRRKAVAGAAAESEGAPLSEPERSAWKSAISEYQNSFSRMDLVFDRAWAAETKTLAEAGDDPEPPPALDKRLRAVLLSAAPIYRQYWWPKHSNADLDQTGELQRLLLQHGRPIADFIAQVWRKQWPSAGFTVEVSAYANWAGAYSTTGGLIVISSMAPGNAGSEGLEILFHEAMHQWDRATTVRIEKVAHRMHQPLPPQLLHSLIFYTAGFAVARTVPDHQPYAQANGLWARGVLYPVDKLDTHWRSYLEGRTGFEEAIQGLLSPAGAEAHPVK